MGEANGNCRFGPRDGRLGHRGAAPTLARGLIMIVCRETEKKKAQAVGHANVPSCLRLLFGQLTDSNRGPCLLVGLAK